MERLEETGVDLHRGHVWRHGIDQRAAERFNSRHRGCQRAIGRAQRIGQSLNDRVDTDDGGTAALRDGRGQPICIVCAQRQDSL